MLSAATLLAAAGTPVFADHYDRYTRDGYAGSAYRYGGLTKSELDTISEFENEANYQRFIHELAGKYGVSPAQIERMAARQGVPRPATKYYDDHFYRNDPFYGQRVMGR
jgi:uncharacterized protein YdbL (DUF1318 family)